MRFNKCLLPSLHFHIRQEWCLWCPLEAKRCEAVAVVILAVKLGEEPQHHRLGEHSVRMRLAPAPPGMALCFGSICPKPDTCFCDAFC